MDNNKTQKTLKKSKTLRVKFINKTPLTAICNGEVLIILKK